MLVAQSAFVMTKFLQFSSLPPNLEPEMWCSVHHNSKLCFGIIQVGGGGVSVYLSISRRAVGEGNGVAVCEKFYPYVGRGFDQFFPLVPMQK